MDTISTNIHDRLLSWLGVGGHISVSMDTINTNIHDRLLSWLGVGGHISVSMDSIHTTIHGCVLSWLGVGGHISVSQIPLTQLYPAISTCAVQICYSNKFLLYSY